MNSRACSRSSSRSERRRVRHSNHCDERTLGEEDGMFSHIMIGTNDLEKAKSFYDALLGALDVPPGRVDRQRFFYKPAIGVFAVPKPIDAKPATPANGGTIGFVASSPEQADTWHA